jgi:hypothetical protein
MPEPESTDSLADIQRQHILRVLEKTGWVISGPNGAGAILNVHPNTLHSIMKRLGIRRPTHLDLLVVRSGTMAMNESAQITSSKPSRPMFS